MILADNHRLSGTLSAALIYLPSLNSLVAHGNSLSGSIPLFRVGCDMHGVCRPAYYENATLTTLTLARNFFRGTLDVLETQTKLHSLMLNRNTVALLNHVLRNVWVSWCRQPLLL